MRILFMGTPDFAVCSLDALIENGYDLLGVVCQPDKPKGRGYEVTFPPVKEYALTAGIEVMQPISLKKEALLPDMRRLNPDIIVVVAYGKILPKYILDYPRYGCINVHASLLPKLRGASPIQWSIVTGEKVTGVTTMMMAEGLDTGDMLLKEELAISENDTAASLHDKLMVLGGRVLTNTLRELEAGAILPKKQDDLLASYAPIITKEMAKIDWNKNVDEIRNLVRGMFSWPVAHTTYKGKTVKIIQCTVEYGEMNCQNGEICEIIKGKGIKVAAPGGCIVIHRFKFDGKREMTPDEYMMGNQMAVGDRFI